MSDFGIEADELSGAIGTAAAPRIFDVRRVQDYAEARRILPAARWRDHRSSPDALAIGSTGGASDIVVYCTAGGRCSQTVASRLRQSGVAARYLVGGFEAWSSAGGLTIRKDALPGRDETQPSVWVTRVRPKIDRIACPWLISRFIDPDAVFLFVEPAQVIAVAGEVGGIPYDIEGVAFGHDGPRCTFDTLIKAFDIADKALDELALIVRGADTARLDLMPEAAGLLAVSLGNSQLAGGDDRRALELGLPVYDALLAWRRHASSERHNWPRPGV